MGFSYCAAKGDGDQQVNFGWLNFGRFYGDF